MKILTACLAATMLVPAGAGTATAASLSASDVNATTQSASVHQFNTNSIDSGESTLPVISREDYSTAFKEFMASPVRRDITIENGVKIVTFHLPEGFDMTMVDPVSIEARFEVQSISGGRTEHGIYIGFNQFDQNVLSNAAAAGALTAAICAIPAVGPVACAVAGLAISVAVSYVHKNGVCSGGQTLYWYDVRAGSTVQCRSSHPA